MKLKGKLLTIFLIPLIVIGLIGLGGLIWSDRYFINKLNNENIKVQAGLEIEINEIEITNDILNYITYQTPKFLEQYKKNLAELKHFLNQYKSKDISLAEKEHIQTLETHIQEFQKEADLVIAIQAQQFTTREEVKNVLEKQIDPIIEKQWIPYLKTQPNASSKINLLNSIQLKQHKTLSKILMYLLTHDNASKEKINTALETLEHQINTLSKSSINTQEQTWYTELQKYNTKFSKAIKTVITLEDQEQKFRQSITMLSERMDKLLDDQLQPIAVNSLKKSENKILSLIGIIAALMIILIAISGYITWRNFLTIIINPITTLKNYADKISRGNSDINVNITQKDELGELANSFKKLIQNTHELAKVSKALGEGKFDTEVTPRSDNDTLALSLIEMKENLQELDIKNKQQIWIKTQISELTESIQGMRDLQKIILLITEKLAQSINAGVATFYLLQKESKEEEGVLELFGSYAYTKRKGMQNKFKFGEGIIGQCAREMTTIIMTDLPDNYIEITSGTGKEKPVCIISLPIAYEDNLIGVMEFGLFTPINEQQREVLEQAATNIAVIINGVLSHHQTEELLEKSQELNSELNVKQEQMQEANRKLEEQTKKLQQSEEELRSQSEELRVMNEELEEKTDSLEQQKQELESARLDLEKRAEDLALSSKYKSEFLANMSHELRTPLNSLLILSKKLADNKEKNLTEKQQKSAEVIHRGGTELLTLINDILDLSKVESGKLQIETVPCNIKTICDNIKSQFDPLMVEKHINFELNISSNLPEIFYSDDQRITQVLRNFISNACKFTSEGSITLSVEHPKNPQSLAGKKMQPDQLIAFSVKDTGIGIPAEKQALIFEAFQQAEGSTSRKYGGTGLGLAISRAMADLMGGTITLESEEGIGSIFTLLLPNLSEGDDLIPNTKNISRENKPEDNEIVSTQPSNSNPAAKAQKNTSSKNQKMTILIVDDDDAFSEIISDFSNEHNYDAIIAKNGKEAIAKAISYKPDAILLDLGLPDMDGMEVLEKLKNDLTTRNIPVHIISGREENPKFMQEGAIGYLKKPATDEMLLEVFNKFEEILQSEIKHVLLIEHNPHNEVTVNQLIASSSIKTISTDCGKKALEYLKKNKVDCIILDINLPDMSGSDLVKQISEQCDPIPPIVIYTENKLSEDEYKILRKYTSSIVIKGANSPERLLDEVTLFLHTVESDLSSKGRNTIKMLHSGSEVLDQKKVLLVDDDMRNVFALSSELEEYNMNVIIASNGQQALEKLSENTDVDLILMDIMMPVMDGYTAMQKIRNDARFKELPIITLTAKAMAEDKQKCMQAGASDYISKPVDTDQLISMLKVWLSKK